MIDAATTSRPYARYLRAAAAMGAGLALGFLMTLWSLHSGYGFNPMRVGPWTAWRHIGDSAIDPYARAALARAGEAPLGRDIGLAFIAQTDSDGAPLDGACEYKILDHAPAARFWTISLASPEGALIANPTQRYGFSSVDVLRRENGSFEIAIARAVRPGNWLSPGDARNFVIALRLYDTPLDVDSQPETGSFPRIVKLNCA
ncbi:MAG: DUF1214 domain-containing protein [Methylocystis sp.]|nr:DUF1214 domain-containing protein [Methylocystis sp.]